MTGQNAVANSSALTFSPDWTRSSGSPAGLAYALYRFTVTGYYGPHQLQLDWSGANDGEVYLAVANFATNRWSFVPEATSGRFTLSDSQWEAALSPGMRELFVVPFVTGTSPRALQHIRVGNALGAFKLLGVTPTTVIAWDNPPFMPIYTGADPVSWSWDFGGACHPSQSKVTGATPDPLIRNTGSFDCSVTATLADGTVSTLDFTLNVVESEDAAITLRAVWPNAGETGSTVMLRPITDGGLAAQNSWNWNFGGGAVPNTSALDSPEITLGAPGAYPASVSCSNSQGTASLDFTLYVTEPGGEQPPCLFGASSSPFDCMSGAPGTMFALRATAGEAETYEWNFGGAATPNTSTAATPQVLFNAPGVYHGTVKGTNAAGSSTSGFTIHVRQPAVPEILNINIGTIKTGIRTGISAQNTAGEGSNWRWNLGNAADPSIYETQAPQFTPLAAGTYNCRVEVSNAAGSDGHDFQLVVVDPGLPQITDVLSWQLIRTVQSVLVADNQGDEVAAWEWELPAGLNAEDITSANPRITPTAAGSYDCRVTASNLAGASVHDFTLTVEEMLPPDLTSVWPENAISGQTRSFFANTSCVFDMTWTWDFGGGATPNTSTDDFPSVMPGAPGTYNGVVTATNAGGTTTFNFTYTVLPQS